MEEALLRELSREDLPTFREVQEWTKKVGLPVAGRRALAFGNAVRNLLSITADSPRTIEREKRNKRLEDFDRARSDRDGDYKSQINRDAKEVARERGCHGC